jgi:hypothetical protein
MWKEEVNLRTAKNADLTFKRLHQTGILKTDHPDLLHVRYLVSHSDLVYSPPSLHGTITNISALEY